MSKCWASPIGSCGAPSREHVFSQSIFGEGEDRYSTKGMQRIPEGPFSIHALTAKILCRTHNSMLADCDQEAGRLASHLQALALGNVGSQLVVDGSKIERWALKTAINNFAAGWTVGPKWCPPRPLVEVAFGLAKPATAIGLYAVDASMGMARESREEASFNALWEGMSIEKRRVVGGYVGFHGMIFFTAFEAGVVDRIKSHKIVSESERLAIDRQRHIYHPASVTVESESGLRTKVLFSW